MFVIGVYVGMVLALITTFIAINVFFLLSATIAPDSPMHSLQLASSMFSIVDRNTESFCVFLSALAWFLFYICV